MDESFKKMSEDLKSTYHSSFWDKMKQQLDNDSMDDAFKFAAEDAAIASPAKPESLLEDVDNAFLDDAFREASKEHSVNYFGAYWSAFEASRSELEMADAFKEAAKATKANYKPHYWTAADAALQEEGLHYEYKRAYWDEAKVLLDKSDRRVFFFRWSGVATILMLFSIAGIGFMETAVSNTLVAKIQHGEKATSFLADAHQQMNTLEDLNPVDEGNLVTENNQNDQAQNNNGGISYTVGIAHTEENQFVVQTNQEDAIDVSTELIGTKNAENNTSTDNQSIVESNLPGITLNRVNETNVEEVTSELARLNPNLELIPVLLPNSNQIKKLSPITKKLPMIMHEISAIGMTGFGNQYNTDAYLAQQRNNISLSYRISGLGNKNNFGIELSGGLDRMKSSGLEASKSTEKHYLNKRVERFWYEVVYLNALYANGDVGFTYQFGKRNVVMFGLGINYLAGVQTNLAMRTDEEKGIEVFNDNWGIKEGFQPFDGRLNLGYEYRLTNNFSVQVRSTIGLTDRTDNLFFESEKFDREKSIMFGLKYTLFRGLK